MSAKKNEFTNLVKTHSGMLFRYAYWLSGSESIAKDLVQETFLRAWKSYESLEKKESAKYWLITILRRENARRFERKRLKQVDTDVDQLEASAVYGAMDTSTEAYVLRRALGKISEEYREPLLLQQLFGYTCQEIADQLDLTPEAVMTRLYRARKKLKTILDDSEPAPEGPKGLKP